jgi:outer membrane protein OmpA-like peptidoglycan-associated protein
MNPRIMISTLVASLSLVLAVGCSSSKKEKKTERPPSAAVSAMNEASQVDQPTSVRTKSLKDQVDFAALEFDQGEAKLSDMDRRHLNELAIKMTGAGKIVDDIKILTWSDRKVVADEDATNTEIILARQRAESIKRYLERTLPAEENIDFYNMAENPKRYTEYMNRKGVPVEQAFNEQGKGGSPEGRALVIIEYQSGPMPSTL